ncbi:MULTISPECIES: adenosylmethionine--8-amino-7-oxononanoate transaminase [unclassified Synechococcus]|uniref:adenosylmethionine--8-amino-7-oxononanoate transaminase n=1 Tax=unclassified Synechococcus TaxID=2626047 RepID=UPI0021A70D5B|nr:MULTISPECIES: adenosylmethionine--8-amino-7-oxononanoate transaminase [unclassified Synechococcus]MCT0213388.1 adenosylmethionine--8-amino-7-oxononanoate transaminase [Synechococcus sp. CS-1326]MCT0232758.1 adenosylmethionine--8-amino-7-oxononanoate transaminase [Synechococcus sp. CS-1327]
MSWHPNLWHPTTQVACSDPPLAVLRGDGALLELADGRRLIDAISSWWVTLHGHAEPSIAAAIAAQALELEQVIFANFRHPQAERLAESLSAASGLERLFFSDDGSTAVEVALKIAWQWWRNQASPRRQLIAFEGAYHGDTFGAMAVGERGLFSAPFEPLLCAVARAPWPSTWWDDGAVEAKEAAALDRLEELLTVPTAAVILEPVVQGASGMAIVRSQFLQQVERRVRQAGALLIADEVMTGFGRTGSLFASRGAGLQPDLVALSKGLTGGFLPMGVTLAREALYQGFISDNPDHTLYHGHSFTANPLGCAAANASLALLCASPDRYEGFEARHRPRLAQLARHPLVCRPRLIGTIAAFDLVVDSPGYLNRAGRSLQRHALAHGVFIRPLGQVVYLLPPLCLSEAQLDRCYQVIEAGLDQL